MILTLVLLLVGGLGIWFTVRHLKRNWRELRSRPKGSVKTSDLVFSYGLSFLWFGYLLAFFTGLIVNNLLLR